MNSNIKLTGEVITFYSYKGGAGRTMALANVACLLGNEQPRLSKKVLMIDWDLEAPGLHRFFLSDNKLPENDQRPGIINYFESLRTLLDKNPELYDKIKVEGGWQELNKLHPLEDYIIENVQHGVDFIKAGAKNLNYSALVATFDWVSFYNKYDFAIKAFRELITHTYDFCLIDSRTGFTDTSGVCTMLLPEKLVVIFTPNKQSLEGVLELVEKAAIYRRSSCDLRPLTVFPLPSRIDDAEDKLRRKWRKNYQEKFQALFQKVYDLEKCDLTNYFDEIKLPYKSYYGYGEIIAVMNERDESLSLHRAYKDFYARLVSFDLIWELIKIEKPTVWKQNKKDSRGERKSNKNDDVTILIVEDSNKELNVTTDFFKHNYPDFWLDTAKTANIAIKKLKIPIYDIVLLDIKLGKESEDTSGFEVSNFAHKLSPRPYVIGYTKFYTRMAEEGWRKHLNQMVDKTESLQLREAIDEAIAEVKRQKTSLNQGIAFCIMPFSKRFDDLYKVAIKRAINDVGYNCHRMDEQFFVGSITDKIHESIESADVIVALLTDNDPNVFYEVGYAYQKGIPVILICDKAQRIPFDIHDKRNIIYEDIPTLYTRLKNTCERLI